MSMIAEGIFTAKSVHQLQLKHNVEMPIHEAIYQVLFQKKDPKNSVAELMTQIKRRIELIKFSSSIIERISLDEGLGASTAINSPDLSTNINLGIPKIAYDL